MFTDLELQLAVDRLIIPGQPDPRWLEAEIFLDLGNCAYFEFRVDAIEALFGGFA